RRSLERVPGTDEVHDLHVWSLTTGRYALSAHAVVAVDHDADDAILAAMAAICAREFHIEHVTIQIEHESRRAAEPAHLRKHAPMTRLVPHVLSASDPELAR